MRIPPSDTLHGRLLGFLGALFLALLAIGLAVRSIAVDAEKEHAAERASELARLFATNFQQRLGDTKALLGATAALRLHERPAADCNARLAELLASYAYLKSLAVLEDEHRTRCMAGARGAVLDAEARKTLQDADDAREFALSPHRKDSDGTSSLLAVLPLAGAAGARFLLAELDLDWINRQLAVGVPSGVVVRVLDRGGTFIVRQPDPGCCLGRSGLELPGIRQALASGAPQVMEDSLWLDGVRRLQSDVPLAGGGVLSVGIPLEAITRTTDSAVTKAVTLLLLFVAAAGVLAWLGAEVLVLRPIRRLGAAARRIGAGELCASLAVGKGSVELNQLAMEFNQMAGALAGREQARSESEERLRLTLDAALDAVVGMDQHGRVTAWNAEAERMFGYTRAETLGQALSDLIIPPAQREAHAHGMKRFLATGRGSIIGKRVEVTALRADGSELPIELAIATVRSSNGLFFNAFMRDLRERRRADAELRTLSRAVEQSPVSIVITDRSPSIVYVNPRFEQATGYTRAEVIGRNPRLLASGTTPAETYRDLWKVISEGGEWRGELCNRRKDGELFWEFTTISGLKGSGGKVSHYIAVKEDITERRRLEAERKQAEERIHSLAFFDPLTHLPNRRLLLDRLKQAFSANARRGTHGAVFFIDLDQFKTLNDTKGHAFGDLLLIEVAQRLQACVRGEDTVARLGGDEFVVMLSHLGDAAPEAAAQAVGVGEKMLAAISRPYVLKGQPHYTSCSIGVSLFRGNDLSADDLLKRADMAMYQAKSAGRGAVRFFDPAMQAALDTRAAMEFELRGAVERGQLRLHYQMQIDTTHGSIGAEALLRWAHPERGLVPPAQFIPLVEDSGLIVPIGQWVVETACAQLKRWERDPRMHHLQLAVNVSARQFRQADFVARIQTSLEASGANPARLKLELTESLMHENVAETIAKMNALKGLGIGFSMDDFGTGHSSLSNLKRLPLDQLKIDQSFVRDLVTDPNDAAIVKTIIGMAKSLGLAVIAEGVETEAQRQFLVQLGCVTCQGYLFGHPMPAAEFEAQVRAFGGAEEADVPAEICA